MVGQVENWANNHSALKNNHFRAVKVRRKLTPKNQGSQSILLKMTIDE